MTQVKFLRRADGEHRYVCGHVTNGRNWVRIGCQHLTPREAVRHATSFDATPSPAPDLPVPGLSGAPQTDASGVTAPAVVPPSGRGAPSG